MIKKIYDVAVRAAEAIVLMIISSLLAKSLVAWFIFSKTGMFVVKTNFFALFVGETIIIAILLGLWFISGKLRITSNVIFSTMIVLGTTFIIWVQLVPASDANGCYKVATELHDGILATFLPGGYIDTYRHQIGLILFETFLTYLFGAYNFMAFQWINVLLLSLTSKKVYEYIEKNYPEYPQAPLLVFSILVLFTPIWMTACYTYGNFPGSCMAILAMIYQAEYLHRGKKINAILSTIFITVACLFNGIMYIPFIAIMIVYLATALCSNSIKYMAWVLISILFLLGADKAIDYTINSISDGRLRDDGGTNSLACVMMGLDVDKNRIGGWFNGYNPKVYVDQGFDAQKTTEVIKKDLENKIAEIVHNPTKYVQGMSAKNFSIWLDPTFASLERISLDHDFQIERHSVLFDDLTSDGGRLNRVLIMWLRFFQLAIYIGALLFLIYDKKPKTPVHYVGPLTFLGGWIFFTVWEAKSEYVLLFFVILIPYSVFGFCELFKACCSLINHKTGHINFGKVAGYSLCVMLTAIVTLCNFKVTDNSKEYNTIVADRRFISPGDYDIACIANQTIVFDNIFVDFDLINAYYYRYIFNDNSQRMYHGIFSGEIDNSQVDRIALCEDVVKFEKLQNIDNSDLYSWRILRESGGYVIKWWYDQNLVWTFDENNGTVYLSNFERGNKNQIWTFQ